MISLATVLAICCLATTKAKPSFDESSKHLEGVPDLQSFGETKYPKYDLLDLGEYSKGHLPGDEYHITKRVTIKEPQPYPVKIPVPHPYPVTVAKPYPVVETKYVKVPYAVPYEIEKKVPVPVEVPRPYPVPVHGNSGWNGDLHLAGSGNNYGVQHINEGGHDNSYQSEDQQQFDADQGIQENQGGWTGLQSSEHQ